MSKVIIENRNQRDCRYGMVTEKEMLFLNLKISTHIIFRLSKVIDQILEAHNHFVEIYIFEKLRSPSINLQRF